MVEVHGWCVVVWCHVLSYEFIAVGLLLFVSFSFLLMVAEGALAPDNIMIRMVLDDAIDAIKTGQSLLLDGFPCTMEQAVALDKNLDIDLVINLCIPNETIIERILDRWDRWCAGVFFFSCAQDGGRRIYVGLFIVRYSQWADDFIKCTFILINWESRNLWILGSLHCVRSPVLWERTGFARIEIISLFCSRQSVPAQPKI